MSNILLKLHEAQQSNFTFDGERVLFRALLGNPPYTKNVTSRDKELGTEISIYPEFFALAYELSAMASIVSPARWLTSAKPETASAREEILARRIAEDFENITYYEHTTDVFEGLTFRGGVSWWLYCSGSREYSSAVEFIVNGETEGHAPLFLHGIIEVRGAAAGVSRATHASDYYVGNKAVGWIAVVNDTLNAVYGSRSNGTALKYGSNERRAHDDIRLLVPRHGWVYHRSSLLDDRGRVPRGKFAIAFAGTSSNSSSSLNDRTIFCREFESAKSTVAFYVASAQGAANLYKYARTKFFRFLVEARLSSHSTYNQAYADVPWGFRFDASDPIDWTGSVREIDEQLEVLLKLGRWHEEIQAVPRPFARALACEYLESLEASGANVEGLHEWYGETLDS